MLFGIRKSKTGTLLLKNLKSNWRNKETLLKDRITKNKLKRYTNDIVWIVGSLVAKNGDYSISEKRKKNINWTKSK